MKLKANKNKKQTHLFDINENFANFESYRHQIYRHSRLRIFIRNYFTYSIVSSPVYRVLDIYKKLHEKTRHRKLEIL